MWPHRGSDIPSITLSVGRKAQVSPTLEWRDITQTCEYREAGKIEGHPRVYPPQMLHNQK